MKSKPLSRAISAGVLLVCAAGCATKTEARKQAEAAFQAGQRQAQLQLYESRFPVVTVIGPVRNPKLDWTADLTLARAIVAAGYQGLGDPRLIIVRRGNEEVRVSPRQLLAGEDWPLQGGDHVEIVP